MVRSMEVKNAPSMEQTANVQKFMSVYAAVPDKEKSKSIAIVCAFMDGMAAQRLLNEAKQA